METITLWEKQMNIIRSVSPIKIKVARWLFLSQFLLIFYHVCQGSGIVAFIGVCQWDYWTTKFLGFIQSHVATTYLCMHSCSNNIGWSNQGKYYEIERHCVWWSKYFSVWFFCSENTSRLAKQTGYPVHDPWHTW